MVIGGHINGLGIIRSLSKRGIPVAVITTKPYDISQYSNAVLATAAVPETEENPELLVELLERRAVEWQGWALFPSNDGALSALARFRERLSSSYRVVAPPWEVARHVLDKDLMRRAAEAAGITVPRCYGTAEGGVANTSFPVIVKPVLSHRFYSFFGCKLFIARDREELAHCIRRIEQAQIACSIYECIPGPDTCIYSYCLYMDARCNPSPGITVRKLRQSPPLFGVARVAEVAEEVAGLREASVELLRGVGFRGMAAVEFKLDERDGRFYFMEVNGRSVLYNGLLRRAGLDLAGMAWSDHVSGCSEPVTPTGWPGVWVNLHADLMYSLLVRGKNRIGLAEYLAPYRRPVYEAVWSARDPGPFFAQWLRTISEGASALRQGRYRELLSNRMQPPGVLKS